MVEQLPSSGASTFVAPELARGNGRLAPLISELVVFKEPMYLSWPSMFSARLRYQEPFIQGAYQPDLVELSGE